MKAFIKTSYGGPEVLQLKEVEKPSLTDDGLLVKVMANSANPADWHILRGKPYVARFTYGFFKPTRKLLGADFAGTVEAVGKNVRQFSVGDRVFGQTLTGGAFAEYISIAASHCWIIPEGVGFAQMASVSLAGLTALQALITHGHLQDGETVLINGSTGGVGQLAVQLAKTYGATVSAVCSSQSIPFVKTLGADQVIAYDKENIHQHRGRYDLILDTHGNLSFDDYQRMGRRGVMVGFTSMGHMIALLLKRTVSPFPIAQFTAKANQPDLSTLAAFLQQGKLTVHIEKTYSYTQIPLALRHLEAMRTKGKVAMSWETVNA